MVYWGMAYYEFECRRCGLLRKHRSPGSSQCRQCTIDDARRAVYDALGGKCVCCGETEKAFLVIDHIGDDGYADRNRGRRTVDITTQYRQMLATLHRFQVLCANCNHAKARGGCPHVTGTTS